MILSDYSVFPEYQSNFTDLNRESKNLLKDIAYNYLEYKSIHNNISFVLTNPLQFRFINDRRKRQLKRDSILRTLKKQKLAIEKVLSSLEMAKSEVIQKQSEAKTFDDLNIETAEVYGRTVLLPPRYKGKMKRERLPISVKHAFPIDYLKAERFRAFGDTNMYGHSPRIKMSADVDIIDQQQKLRLRWKVRMEESEKDWTVFRTRYSENIYDVSDQAPHLRIRSVSPRHGEISAQTGKKDYQHHSYNGSGLLIKATGVVSDSKGSEVGRIGARDLYFEELKIDFRHEEDFLNEPYELIPYNPDPE